MLKRTLTGICILLLVAGFVALRLVSTLFFDFFVLIISIVSVFELIKAYVGGEQKKKCFVYVAVVYPSILFGIYLLSSTFVISALLQILALLVMFCICFVLELSTNAINRKKNIINETTKLLDKTKTTMFLCIYPTTLLGFFYGINAFGLNIGFIGIILCFAISMFTDTFAYTIGTIFRGKGAKICPEMSPNKGIIGMIAGSIGGIVAGILGFVFFYLIGILGDSFAFLSTWKALIVFISVGFFGTFLTQFGDFLSSVIKRKTGIKDFGNIFPGHGGFMDRIDGLMFCAPIVFCIIYLALII